MRCQFCGWDNPEGCTSCEKCNKPLSAAAEPYAPSAPASPADGSHSRPTSRQAGGAAPFNPKATVLESNYGGRTVGEAAANAAVCPSCGYPLEGGNCPSCGYSAAAQPPVPPVPPVHIHPAPQDEAAFSARRTIRPVRKGAPEGSFTLTPISEQNGLPEGDGLSYEGNDVVLNRANTDPKNATITSHAQASIHFADGQWTITDESNMQTTFVQAQKGIVLESGTLILLGNQLYRFDSLEPEGEK